MGKAMIEAARPPMWQIEATGKDERQVRFGTHTIAISDIAGVSLEEVRDRQASGLFFGATAFLFAAGVLAYFVFEAAWRTRFLIGTVFLGVLGSAGFVESLKLKRVSLYQLTLTLKSGRRVVFTSSDRADIQALALRIAAERAQSA